MAAGCHLGFCETHTVARKVSGASYLSTYQIPISVEISAMVAKLW